MFWTRLPDVSRRVWEIIMPKVMFSISQRDINSTSWLDGVRGMASFIVFLHHCSQVFLTIRYGWTPESHLIQLPVVRILYSGAAMVTVFFVVSGYALSYRGLQLARKGDSVQLMSSLASSTFRRAIRLYIPCAAVSVIVAVTAWLDLFDEDAKSRVPQNKTAMQYLWLCIHDIVLGSQPFTLSRHNPFLLEPNMWTIPYEFRGSMIVFLTLLALGRAQDHIRLMGILGSVAYLILIGQWDAFLFVSGILCCEIHLVHEKCSQKYFSSSTTGHLPRDQRPVTESRRHKVISVALFLVALYVLSIPEGYEGMGTAPLWSMLVSNVPASWQDNEDPGRFWTCLSAVALILIIDQSLLLRRIFTTRFAQYMAYISFSFYLMHACLMNTILRRLVRFITAIMASFLPAHVASYVLGLSLAMAIFLPIAFWASEIATRCMDEQSVALARRLEKKCFRDQPRSG